MRRLISISLFGLFFAAAVSCSRGIPFASYQQEVFEITPITGSATRTIKLVNPHGDTPQHIRAIGFDGGGNPGGHFSLKGAKVGGRELPLHDLSVPAGAALELQVAYVPRNLETTKADFGGRITGEPESFRTHAPRKEKPATGAMAALLGEVPKKRPKPPPIQDQPELDQDPDAIHRALLIVTYDIPREGVLQLELVGGAVPGPNGETSASGGGGGPVASGECTPGGRTACFSGTFGILLPGLMKGEVETELSGAVPITIDGQSASMDMAQFPVALFVIEGNGPGEPLEGKPIAAISIAISGNDESFATGNFDGSTLSLSDAGFRIRIYFAAVTLDDVASSAAPVDFRVGGLEMVTIDPLAGDQMTLGVDTILGQNPSGNALADPLLSGAEVVVRMRGTLALP